MKTYWSIHTPVLALALAAAGNLAAEPGEGKTQPWLGVATAPVDEVAAAQLDLPEGVGAAVKVVVPDSPAAAAGLQKNDILFEFDGAPVHSPEHLRELVAAKAPGDAIDLAVIHRGAKKMIGAELGTRPDHLPEAAGFKADLPGVELGDLRDLPAGDEHWREMQERLQKQLQEMLELQGKGGLPGAADIIGMSSKTMVFTDNEGSIEIRSKDGETEVTAKDTEGNVTFEGPVNSEEDRDKLPAKVREKLEQFEGSNLSFDGFELRRPTPETPGLKPGKKISPADEAPAAPEEEKVEEGEAEGDGAKEGGEKVRI